MSDVGLLLSMTIAAMCPMSLMVGFIGGIYLMRSLGPESPPSQSPPKTLEFGQNQGRMWLRGVRKKEIHDAVRGMEMDGWDYRGRQSNGDGMYALSFTKPETS